MLTIIKVMRVEGSSAERIIAELHVLNKISNNPKNRDYVEIYSSFLCVHATCNIDEDNDQIKTGIPNAVQYTSRAQIPGDFNVRLLLPWFEPKRSFESCTIDNSRFHL